MSARKNVPTSTIRTWAKSTEGAAALTAASAPFPGSRGRVHPDTVKVFEKENPKFKYAEKVAEAPTMVIPVTTLDKTGRKTTVKRTLTNAQARAALGQVDANGKMTRGRYNVAVLTDVLNQSEANLFADQFNTAV